KIEESPPRPRSSAAAAASAASPRAQMVTRHPSVTSARALARPSPLLEPVTIATFPVSSRSIARLLAAAATCEVVQCPVERVVRELELVLLEILPLRRQEPRRD